jgi:ring-1,2-phenylacetyl-CoA epoxidase subunit PaaE
MASGTDVRRSKIRIRSFLIYNKVKMALKFHTLKINNIVQETDNAVSVEFEIPNELKETFEYKHGQYVTIKIPLESEERRAYSICSSPLESYNITVAIKEKEDGFVSKYLNNEIKNGDILEVMPPLGNFTIELDGDKSRNLIMFGGGSGITPLMSILKTALIKEPNSKIILFYSNTNKNSIIFKNELDELISKYPDNLFIYHFLSKPDAEWNGEKGRIDKQNAEYIFEKYVDTSEDNEYFLCGHQGMMNDILEVMDNINVDENKIHKESFTVELPDVTQKKSQKPEAITDFDENELTDRNVKIILYNEELEMTVRPDETILTAAQREGFDPPFSCQIGACSTCRAKLESGRVYMEEHDALTDMEIEDGYVLTCQAHPISDDVIVNYDEY